MRFGLFGGATARKSETVGDSQIYGDYVDYVCEAEELGYASVFVVEHHFTGLAQISASLNFLSYLAAKTTRIRLGTAVVVLPWHNPVLLAEQVATLDLMSKGRFDFGIGRGYRPNEFDGFCIPIEDAAERYEEVLEVLKKGLSSSGRWSHHGKHWNFENALIEPPAVQKPHPPFWIGAASATSIQGAAQRGFNLLLDQFGSPATTGERIATYRAELQANGLVYRRNTVAVARALHVVMNEAEREAAYEQRAKFLLGIRNLSGAAASSVPVPTTLSEVKRATDESALIGTPDEIIQQARALQAVGVEYVLLLDVNGSRPALRTFAREVMPAFQQEQTAAAA